MNELRCFFAKYYKYNFLGKLVRMKVVHSVY
jgi:hypothetical protein